MEKRMRKKSGKFCKAQSDLPRLLCPFVHMSQNKLLDESLSLFRAFILFELGWIREVNGYQ